MTITAPAPVTVERLETRSRERLARAESLLRQLESTAPPFTKSSVMTPLNDLQVELHNLMAECGIYIAMHPDRDVQQLAEKLQREGNELGQRQLQCRAAYDALGAIDPSSLSPVDRRFADVARMDMQRAGALLGPAERDRARALRAELTKLRQDHARNIRDDTRYIALEGLHELDGLPPDFVDGHQPGPDGVIRLSTNPPDHQPFMAYAHSDRARKALQTAYLERSPQNVEVLAALTRARHELARLLGFPTWAHYNVEDRMVETPEALERFFAELDAASADAAKAELQVLLEEKRIDHPVTRDQK